VLHEKMSGEGGHAAPMRVVVVDFCRRWTGGLVHR
jgi:hypothetical protein